jgi:hypothetical protein
VHHEGHGNTFLPDAFGDITRASFPFAIVSGHAAVARQCGVAISVPATGGQCRRSEKQVERHENDLEPVSMDNPFKKSSRACLPADSAAR